MKKMSLCTIGNCVHVAGVMNFSALAEREGYEVDFMGISLPIDDVIENVKCSDPDVIGLSYRLSPEPLEAILNELKEKLEKSDLKDKI